MMKFFYDKSKTLLIALDSEIVHASVKELTQAITWSIDDLKPTKCILDFMDVEFMDASGIAMIINILRSMVRIEGALVLTDLKDQPMRVLRASGVDKLVSIEDKLDFDKL